MCTPNRITTQLLQPGESITPRRSGGPFCAWPPFRHVTTRMTTLLDHPPYESPSTRDTCLGSLQGGQPAPEKHYHAYNAGIHVWLWQRNKCSRRESVNAGPRHILWYNLMQSTKKKQASRNLWDHPVSVTMHLWYMQYYMYDAMLHAYATMQQRVILNMQKMYVGPLPLSDHASHIVSGVWSISGLRCIILLVALYKWWDHSVFVTVLLRFCDISYFQWNITKCSTTPSWWRGVVHLRSVMHHTPSAM